MKGNNEKETSKEGPRRLVRGAGRNGSFSWLLLLLLEECTQRVVSSYGLDKEAYHVLKWANGGRTHWVVPSWGKDIATYITSVNICQGPLTGAAAGGS